MRAPRLSRPEGNALRSLAVGGCLVVVLAVAIGSSVLARRQLDDAARTEATITNAQERVDDLLQAQLGEEAALQQSLIAKGRGPDPYATIGDPFPEVVAALRAEVRAAHVPQALPLADDLLATHRAWEREVARPLWHGAAGARAARLQAYGKVLADRLESRALELRDLLGNRMHGVQASLTVAINRTVEYSIGFVVLFAVAAVVLVVRASLTKAELDRRHAIAETLEGALRMGWDPPPATKVGTAYVSATARAEVGGDFVDLWRLTDDAAALLIADLAGKGVAAAGHTAFVKYTLRTLLAETDDPGPILTRFNAVFARTISDPSLFVALFLGVFHPATGLLRYASAGHGPAFLRRAGGVELLPVTGPVVGITPTATYETRTVRLAPDETLLLTTDGFTEARDRDGRLLGYEGASAIVRTAPAEPQALCDCIVAAVTERSGGRITDDLALLAVSPASAQASLGIG